MRKRVEKPKDGLRAVCPRFKARSSHLGVHVIECGDTSYPFFKVEPRDRYYRNWCCDRIACHFCKLNNDQ